MTTLTFHDGRTFEVPATWYDPTGSHVVALDDVGHPVAAMPNLGAHIGLTDCCGASFTGTESGIVCRRCYAPAAGSDEPWPPLTPRKDPPL